MRHLSRTAVALAVGSAVSMSAQADILITETTEGSGSNKAVEIANTGTEAVTLDGYTLEKDTNGKNEWGQSLKLDGTTLTAGQTLVLVHPKAEAELLSKADIQDSSVINFNGDDPIAIKLNGAIIDIVGDYGDVDYNKDKTLRRSVMTPSATYDASKFTSHEPKDWSDFGQIGEAGEPVEPVDPPEAINATIMDLQGSGWSSEVEGIDVPNGQYESTDYYKVRGVITAIQTSSLGNDLPAGFFIQDETGDGDANTSDGIFVQGSVDGLVTGQIVDVVAKVTEDYGWTKLILPTVTQTETTSTIASTAIRTLDTDEDFDFTLERHEGMLVKFDKDADMRVARTYSADSSAGYRNNLVVSHGQVNMQPNQHNTPGSAEAKSQIDCNQDKRVVVESFVKAANGVVPWYPTFGDDNGTGATDDYIRIGNIVDGLEGALTYSYGDYRLFVTNEATKETFVREGTDRTAAPVLKDGEITVATFNVLNYFNSPFGGAENPYGGSRGAPTADEFALQKAKIVNAILAIDADIVGLMEIENNGFGEGSAVVDLVTRLNEELEDADKYSIAAKEGLEYVGTDVITSQVIFKASKVGLESLRVIQMPQQHAPEVEYKDGKYDNTESGDNYMRDSITPTFTINGTDEKLTVAVNHFKSKGSTCWEDVQTGKKLDADQQGSCENFRVSAAYQLGKTLATIEGNKLIIGDLNSYAGEDPVTVLTNRDQLPEGYQIKAARDTYIGGSKDELGESLHGNDGAVIETSYGYTNVVKALHPESYGYSYKDEVGTLDYILASPSLISKIADATEWNINSVESTLFQYSDKYNCVKNTTDCSARYPDLYRSSDHDPAIIAMNFKTVDPANQPLVIEVPAEAVDMPEVTKPEENKAFDIVFNLTDLSESTLNVGSVAKILISDENKQFVASYSKAFTNTLTEDEIKQGWVLIKVDALGSGEYTFKKYIDEQLVNQETLTIEGKTSELTATVSEDNNKDGGSTGLLGLLSLLGLGFFRRKAQK